MGRIPSFAIFLMLLTSTDALATPPNVLFLAIDDLNDFVGCLDGHPDAKTPHIDALAARGTLFTNAHCQAPICGPSRASLLTGLRPSTSGIYGQIRDQGIRSASDITSAAVFLPDYFERHGYRTAGAGKIFHNGDRAGVFDEFGKGTNFGPKPAKRFAYDPAWFDDREGNTQTDWGVYPDKDEVMPDQLTADWVIDWLSRQDGQAQKPFFLAAGFVRPHVPWYTTQHWFDQHPREGLSLPPYNDQDLADVPPQSLAVNAAPMMPAMPWVLQHDHWPAIIQAYLACTTFADHQVGRVLSALKASPFAENTIIVLWSDHGYHLGEKGRFAKQSLWRRSSHVPLMITAPGLPAGQRVNRPVQLLDIYPTLLELAGLPANPANEGHSLVGLMRSPEADWPYAAITTYGPHNHAVETDRFRWISYEGDQHELYDLRTDPHEWHNLATDPQWSPVISQLRSHLPEINAPNARGSRYDFNAYFRRVLTPPTD